MGSISVPASTLGDDYSMELQQLASHSSLKSNAKYCFFYFLSAATDLSHSSLEDQLPPKPHSPCCHTLCDQLPLERSGWEEGREGAGSVSLCLNDSLTFPPSGPDRTEIKEMDRVALEGGKCIHLCETESDLFPLF